MIFPSADKLEKMDKYTLVILTAKRAKQIKAGATPLIDTSTKNPITVALEEIAAGKVTTKISKKDEIVPTTPSIAQTFAADLLTDLPSADDSQCDSISDDELLAFADEIDDVPIDETDIDVVIDDDSQEEKSDNEEDK